MEWFLVWLVFSCVVGAGASARGRSGFGWFLLSALISPLLALVLLLLLPRLNAAAAVSDAERATPETHVRCPDCRELVRMDARKCKHCGSALVPMS